MDRVVYRGWIQQTLILLSSESGIVKTVSSIASADWTLGV